jgi:hypothetical protein
MAGMIAYTVISEKEELDGWYGVITVILMSLLWFVTVGWLVAGWLAERRDRRRRTGGRRARPPHAYRWSDNDRYWWRFTYANENRSDGRGREERRILGLYLTSKGEEDEGGFCLLRGHLVGHTLILRLPAWLKPKRTWVASPRSFGPTGARFVQGYWQVDERSYGFLFVRGELHLDYGAKTGDSSTDKGKVFFLPWRSWRHVRFSLYGLDGEHIWSQFDKDRPRGKDEQGVPLVFYSGGYHDQRRVAQDAAPCVTFEFLDFDKTRISAKTQINEREWRLGEGRFRWLSWFAKPKVRRSLDIQFSEETGKRKGSWKGGTIGHSIDMLPEELHRDAFARYCRQHHMTFPAPEKALRIEPQPMTGFVNCQAITVDPLMEYKMDDGS